MLPASCPVSVTGFGLGRGGGCRSPFCFGAWEDVAHVVLYSSGHEDGCSSVLGFIVRSGGQPVWVVPH